MASKLKVDEITNLNENGFITISGNTGLNLSSSTSAIALPRGTTAQRPASAPSGAMRFNTQTLSLEIYNGTAWLASLKSGPPLGDGSSAETAPPHAREFATYNMPSGVYWIKPTGQVAKQTFVDMSNDDGSGGGWVKIHTAWTGSSSDRTNDGYNETFLKTGITANFISSKIYSVFSGGLRSSNYTVQYSDNNSDWTTAWTGVASNNASGSVSCGIQQNTGTGSGSYGPRKYWRFVEGSAVSSHFPRVSRIILTDIDGIDHNIVVYTSDNCSDSGTYQVGTVSYNVAMAQTSAIMPSTWMNATSWQHWRVVNEQIGVSRKVRLYWTKTGSALNDASLWAYHSTDAAAFGGSATSAGLTGSYKWSNNNSGFVATGSSFNGVDNANHGMCVGNWSNVNYAGAGNYHICINRWCCGGTAQGMWFNGFGWPAYDDSGLISSGADVYNATGWAR